MRKTVENLVKKFSKRKKKHHFVIRTATQMKLEFGAAVRCDI